MRSLLHLLIIFLTILVSVSCHHPKGVKESDTFIKHIRIDGSSTEYPLSAAIVREYLNETNLVKIDLYESSTGGGFEKFIRKETDINNASRPITEAEAKACEANGINYLELMVAYDAIAVVVNRNNSWVKDMTMNELKRLWHPDAEGNITRWNQLRPEWPDTAIHLYGPDSTSGTYDFFTQAVAGQAKFSRRDYLASRDDHVIARGVMNDASALGYFGLYYYEESQQDLNLVAIDDQNPGNGAGAVRPTIDNIKNKSYIPLSRPLYIYVNSESLQNDALRSFVSFYIVNCSRLAYETGYIPLDSADYAKSKKTWKSFIKKHYRDDFKGLPGGS